MKLLKGDYYTGLAAIQIGVFGADLKRALATRRNEMMI